MEILLAMMILGLVTAGVFSAFVFSRQVGWRSGVQIMVENYCQGMAENLRLATGVNLPSGLTLQPGYYVDTNMLSPPAAANGAAATRLAALNLPQELQRFQTKPGDGVYLYVEGLANDYDGDGQRGIDFNGDGQEDVRRVTMRVQWTGAGS